MIEVPVLRAISAPIRAAKGFTLHDIDDVVEWIISVPEKWLKGNPSGPSPVYICNVYGLAMEPMIADGERILVNPNMDVKHGDIAVVAVNDRPMVRGVKYERNGAIRLCPVNRSMYEEDFISADDAPFVLRFCGVVQRFLGKDRVSKGIL
jgi:SOS-response transcriptional repressor LexA